MRKCFRCEHFCSTRRDEKMDNFVPHYQQCGRLPTEDKSLKKIYFDKTLQRYCTTLDKHSNYYDFFDSGEIVLEFLQVFENNFVANSNLEIVRFKCTFALFYGQPSPAVELADITDSRVWVMNIYVGFILTTF